MSEAIFQGISKYALGATAQDDAYNDVRGVAAAIQRDTMQGDAPDIAAAFLDTVRPGEDKFMEVNYGNDPSARHGKTTKHHVKGDWKYRTYLPRAYSTAKSALYKGLVSGVDVEDLGKTALETEVRRKTQTVKSTMELARESIAALVYRIGRVQDEANRSAILIEAISSLNAMVHPK